MTVASKFIIGQPTTIERYFNLLIIPANASPVPWLGMILEILKQTYVAIRSIPLIFDECYATLEVARGIIGRLQRFAKKNTVEVALQTLEPERDRLMTLAGWINETLTGWVKVSKAWMFVYKDKALEYLGEFERRLNEGRFEFAMEGMEILSDDIAKLNGEMDTLRAQREADIRVIENMKLQLAEARVVVVRSKFDEAAVARAMKVVADMRMSADPFLFEQMNDGQFDEVDNPVGDATIGGAHFDIHKTKWCGTYFVAAKRLKKRGESVTAAAQERFRRQSQMWMALKSQHILPLLGTIDCKNPGGGYSVYAISPWMRYGDVMMYIKNETVQNRDEFERFRLIYEVALGLRFLHEQSLAHASLQGLHVLIGFDRRVRLTGFTLLKNTKENRGYTQSNPDSAGLRWSPPEIWRCQAISTKSDIWSWAMTALEILSGHMPFKKISYPFALRPLILEPTGRDLPKSSDYRDVPLLNNARIWYLFDRCWKYHLSDRPDIDQVLTLLLDIGKGLGWDPDTPLPLCKDDGTTHNEPGLYL